MPGKVSRPAAAAPRLAEKNIGRMRSIRLALAHAPLLFLGIALIAPNRVASLPQFSRSQRASCSQCHSAFPRLNPSGIAFLQHGELRPGNRGASWNEGEIPLSILGASGVAIRRVQSRNAAGTRREGETDRSLSGSLELAGAGSLGRRLRFRAGCGIASDAPWKSHPLASLQWDDVAGRGLLNLEVGRYEAELPFLSSRRRTTREDYLAPVSLDARGLELNGARSGWAYAAGVMRSQRSRSSGNFNRFADTYFWLMRDLSGQQIAGRMFFGRQDSNLPQHAWLQHLQAEAAARLGGRSLSIVPAYVLDRFDDRPAAGIHDTHHIGLIEVFTPLDGRGRWTLTGRFEYDHRRPTVLTREEDRPLEAVSLACYPRADARVALEWARTSDNVGGPVANRAEAEVRVGF